MPLYDFECLVCHLTVEAFRRIPDRDAPMPCGRCRTRMVRQISRPAPVRPDIAPYHDDGLGTRVESRAHRRQLLRERSLEAVGDRRTGAYGARGTRFSFPGQVVTGVPPSGVFDARR